MCEILEEEGYLEAFYELEENNGFGRWSVVLNWYW